jgi:hypothetical protein
MKRCGRGEVTSHTCIPDRIVAIADLEKETKTVADLLIEAVCLHLIWQTSSGNHRLNGSNYFYMQTDEGFGVSYPFHCANFS